MRIEDYPTHSVKINASEVELIQEQRKVLAVLGNYEGMSVGDFQLHATCLGWSRHSGANLKLDEKLRYFLCSLFFKVFLVSRLCSRLCCHVFGLIVLLS